MIKYSVIEIQTFMISGAEYEEPYHSYASEENDQSGRTTFYTYDVNGNVTQAIDMAYAYVDYEYDAAGNVTKISNDTGENVYSYNGLGSVSAINHNSFNYNAWGALASTKIGSATLNFQ